VTIRSSPIHFELRNNMIRVLRKEKHLHGWVSYTRHHRTSWTPYLTQHFLAIPYHNPCVNVTFLWIYGSWLHLMWQPFVETQVTNLKWPIMFKLSIFNTLLGPTWWILSMKMCSRLRSYTLKIILSWDSVHL